MNIKKTIVVCALFLLIAAGYVSPVAAEVSNQVQNNENPVIPEIDTTSGKSSIIVLTGVVLLMLKRSRSDGSSLTK